MSVDKVVIYSLKCDDCGLRANQYAGVDGKQPAALPYGWRGRFDTGQDLYPWGDAPEVHSCAQCTEKRNGS